jgi:hypothetical protein
MPPEKKRGRDDNASSSIPQGLRGEDAVAAFGVDGGEAV